MKLNQEINLQAIFKKTNPAGMVSWLLIVVSVSLLMITTTILIFFIISINRPISPEQAGGLLNLPAIQRAANLLKEETVEFNKEIAQ